MCRFFVVPGNSPPLQDTSYMEILDILTISCNTIDTQTSDEQINKRKEGGWSHRNKKQDDETQSQCYTKRIQVIILIQWLLALIVAR